MKKFSLLFCGLLVLAAGRIDAQSPFFTGPPGFGAIVTDNTTTNCTSTTLSSAYAAATYPQGLVYVTNTAKSTYVACISNGTAWESAGGSSTGGGGTIVPKTANYPFVSGDGGSEFTFSGSSLTATLPASPPTMPWIIAIKNLNASALAVARNGNTINGGTSNISLQQYQEITCASDTVTGGNYVCGVPDIFAAPITGTYSSNGITLGLPGAAGQIYAGATPALTATPSLGTDNSVAGTVQLANGSAAAHTIFSSGATTTNTIAGFTAAPTTGDLVDCTTASTTCTLTDSGILATNVVTLAGTQTLTNKTLTTAVLGSSTATTQSACDNSTKLATTAYTGIACNTVQTSGSPFSMTGQSETQWNNTSGAYVWDLPATASGIIKCIGNYKTVAKVISLVPPSGSTIYYKGVAGTTSSSTGLVSGGAAGDYICVEAVDSTTWIAAGSGAGTWTNN